MQQYEAYNMPKENHANAGKKYALSQAFKCILIYGLRLPLSGSLLKSRTRVQ